MTTRTLSDNENITTSDASDDEKTISEENKSKNDNVDN
jgi:hypothetical protein